MADARGGKDRPPSSAKNKVVRSQKISQSTSPIDPRHDPSEASTSELSTRAPPIPRSHTPGHLASKSQDRRHRPSELSIRQRSQSAASGSLSLSASQATFSLPSSGAVTPKPLSATTSNGGEDALPLTSAPHSTQQRDRNDSSAGSGKETSVTSLRRPTNLRSTSAIAARPGTSNSPVVAQRGSGGGGGGGGGGGSNGAGWGTRGGTARGTYTAFPPLADARTAPDVPPAPSSGMYWSRAPVSGSPHTALRAHTTTLVGSNVYVFGGCDSRTCFNELYVLDADSFHWSTPHVVGDLPLPLRAMTCTTVGKKLVVFGGGDGPAYYNDVYVLDTVNFRWSRPRILGERAPSKRRAHTACLHKNGIYVFGGGDGIRALNDIWRLDVTDVNKMSWKLISGSSSSSPPSTSDKSTGATKDLRPKARGYHTANMVGSKLIIFGGSDGGECFNDVWVYDVETHTWKAVHIPVTFRRLSHTANIVGSYLFVVGGHDGNEYSNDVLLLNLVTMTWDKRKVYGLPPSGRGYHGTVLHDSRLLVIGGFDGSEVFGDVWMLELAVHAYYSQISHFTIEV